MTAYRKILFFSITSIVIFFASSTTVFAAGAYGGDTYGGGGCVPVYGGGTSCPPEGEYVDKTVKNPATGAYVDALGPEHPVNTRYQPGDEVSFRIQVKNSSNQAINHLDVIDTLPLYTTFVSGPGAFNAGSRTVNYTIDSLAAGAVNEQFLTVRVVPANDLAKDKTLLCGREGVKNVVTMTEEGRATKYDEAPFCIAKPLPAITATKVPAAGVEVFVLPGLLSLLGGGLYLGRKARS